MAEQLPSTWSLNREALAALQVEKLNRLLDTVRADSPFYREKLKDQPARVESLEDLQRFPHTTKRELVEAERSGAWRTRAQEDYVRFHQTSGTSGSPMAVLDTAEDWEGWLGSWSHTLTAAEIGVGDRALLAFSFGPFIGFWTAFEALIRCGVRVLPGGGMNTPSRLDLIERSGATCLLGTPTYVLHLARAGRELGIDVASLPIEKVLVAGEPGGSLPATRERIAEAWGARVIDHAGATEAGAWGFGDDLWSDPPGLRVVESDFVAEFESVETGQPASPGELSHLVLTNLVRPGSPIIRYRTGDLVRSEWPEAGPCQFVRLAGGVIGRADDMVVIRGVNVFPSSIEEVLSSTEGIDQWRLIAERRGEMDELLLEVEDQQSHPDRLTELLQVRLGLRIEVRLVEPGSLPRTEHKSRRLIDKRL